MKHIWGFDVGTTSIGFAVIQYDGKKGKGSILREGVRIFPEGRTEKDLEPRNRARRTARLVRRQIRRRRLRRKLLREALFEAGLLPIFNSPEWDALMNDTGDPYLLRARGLREKLEPFEFGRAIYHLAQRRGFLSARRVEENPDEKKALEKKEGPIKEEIKALSEILKDRTLGEYLAEMTDERKRNRHISRAMVVDEFDRLWSTQAAYHPDLLTHALKDAIRGILLYQRPIFWRLQTVGQCWLEPDEPVCPIGSWVGQQFRMLQHVNNIRVRFSGQPPRPLDSEERKILLNKLHRQADMTFGGVRTVLKKPWKQRGLDQKPEISLESGGETRLLGNAVEAQLADVFGDAWDNHPGRERIRDELYSRLFSIYNRKVGEKRIELHRQDPFKDEVAPAKEQFVMDVQKAFDITRKQAEMLAGFEPVPSWLRFSEKAIRRLIPHLEKGFSLNETGGALDQAYPGWRKAEGRNIERLPSHPRSMANLRNPSVNRALNELRKVVNNLISVHGKPDMIRIELVRELKKTKKDRLDKTKEYRKQEARRKAAVEELRQNGIKPVTAETVEKWLLWEESDHTCPYTGRKVSFDALFRKGEFQVEHIFPLSRSLDNSYLNKTLCATDVNRAKGNQTPFEHLGHNLEQWDGIKNRLERLVKEKQFPPEKVKRFLREDYPQGQEQLEERQKADTSYIAVEARKFLEHLGVPVQVVNGQVTAQLRKAWGLDAILNPDTPWKKNRADHRHHAVDSLAVALTTPTFVKRLSDFYARNKRGEKPRFPLPWANLWSDAKQKTNAIVVSHRRRRKLSGGLHAQTYYGDTGEEINEGGITYRWFVTRKPLERLSLHEIESIRDPEIRRLVNDHLAKHHGDIKKAFRQNNYPSLINNKTGGTRPIIKVRIRIKQQKKLMVPLRPAPKTYADPSDNHHMAIYQRDDGSVHYETVTLFEAIRRFQSGEPVIRRTSEEGGRFVMSLSPGDILEFPDGDGQNDYRVVTSVWASGQTVLEDHKSAEGVVWKRPTPSSIIKMGARKVNVDPVGRIKPAND